MPPLGYWLAGWLSATCCASAGMAIARAADAIRRGLMRIAPLRHRDLYRMGRLRLWNSGKVNERADDDDEQDDEHRYSRHSGAFAEQVRRCIAPRVIELGKRLDRPIVL